MACTIEFDERAERDLSRLDKPIQREIVKYLETRIANSNDPRFFGHALSHNLSGLWRYRVRDYRIVCKFEQCSSSLLAIAARCTSKDSQNIFRYAPSQRHPKPFLGCIFFEFCEIWVPIELARWGEDRVGYRARQRTTDLPYLIGMLRSAAIAVTCCRSCFPDGS